MYGEVPKSEQYKKMDEEFINDVIASQGSRTKGAEHFIQRGWAYFYHDSLDLSMKRFNQAWLLDPENPDIYFGFAGLIEIKSNMDAAIRYYKMGIERDKTRTRAKICTQKIADCQEHVALLRKSK